MAEMSEYYYGQSFVSDDVGRFFWGELPPGVYYIVETKAPHGLETLSDPIRMEINDTDGKIYYGPTCVLTFEEFNDEGEDTDDDIMVVLKKKE